jgi:hypothetical protein
LLVTAAREGAGLLLMLLGAGCAAERAPQRVADTERVRAGAGQDDAGADRGAEPEPPAERDAAPEDTRTRFDAAQPIDDDAAPDAAPTSTDSSPAGDAASADAAQATDARSVAPTRAHCLRDAEDYAARGSYPVSSWEVELDSLDPELAARGHRETFTIFQPTILEADCPHPAVIWGNDRTWPGPGRYTGLLEHYASWGFVAVAPHSPNVTEAHFAAALAFLEEQSRMPESRLFGKLRELVALAGHGEGAIAASRSSAHPDVASVFCVRGCRAPAPGVGLLCLTSTIDGSGACSAAFDATQGPAFVAAHVLGPEEGPVDGRLSTAWLRCQLDADAQACALFRLEGDCILCNELGTWHDMRAKNL